MILEIYSDQSIQQKKKNNKIDKICKKKVQNMHKKYCKQRTKNIYLATYYLSLYILNLTSKHLIFVNIFKG